MSPRPRDNPLSVQGVVCAFAFIMHPRRLPQLKVRRIAVLQIYDHRRQTVAVAVTVATEQTGRQATRITRCMCTYAVFMAQSRMCTMHHGADSGSGA